MKFWIVYHNILYDSIIVQGCTQVGCTSVVSRSFITKSKLDLMLISSISRNILFRRSRTGWSTITGLDYRNTYNTFSHYCWSYCMETTSWREKRFETKWSYKVILLKKNHVLQSDHMFMFIGQPPVQSRINCHEKK